MSEGAGEDVERPADAEAEGTGNEEGAEKEREQEPADDPVDDEAEARAAAAKRRREDDDDEDDDDEDDDDEDDDDEDDDDDEREAAAKKAAPRSVVKAEPTRTSKGRSAKSDVPPTTLSEAEIDSPSKQTLGMLGVVAAATLVMWGVGRAECNYNEVGEGMKPREVSLEERTRTPKDLAFAFEYALASYDFATAKKLSTGDAKKLVEQRERACNGPACEEKRQLLAPKVGSVSELLKRTSSHALARVWSEGGENSKKQLAILKRDGRSWLVESYRPDTGAPVELPGDVPTQMQPGSPTPELPTAPAAPADSTLAVPPGHPPVPGYPLAPRAPTAGGPHAPAASPPAPGTHRPAPGAPAPGGIKPSPGAATPPSAP